MRARLPLLLPLLAGLVAAPHAYAIDPLAHSNAVRLIERLYLHASDLRPQELLLGSAQALSREIDWLIVEPGTTDVLLRHGDGRPIGAVSVGSWDGLPHALLQLETLVHESGHPLGDVDVRLALLQGLTEGLDRYSRVLHGERKERFETRLSGEYEGIGATLGQRDGRLVVVDVIPGGPAESGGLQVGDVVLRIAGQSTVNLPLADAVRLARGRIGTRVGFTVQRDAQDVELQLTRDRVTEPNVRWRVLDDQVGYLSISHISQRTVDNLERALHALRAQGAIAQGLVLDLRGNTGGSMKEAARVADLFLERGLLLRTEGPDGRSVANLQAEMWADARGNEPRVPLVVLVDDRTASGSEIIAGALVEHDRTAVVGTRTFGKGTVQKIYNIDDEAQLKLTVAQYVLANQRLIADEGIVPDVVVGRVELGAESVRFHDFDEEAQGTRFVDILPHVLEHREWRGQSRDPVDLPLEIARRAALRAQLPTRVAALTALRRVAAEVRAEEERHLAEALSHRGIDWSPAPAAGPVPLARVNLSAAPDPDRKDVLLLRAEVENTGAESLHRVLVELDCDTFRFWDDVVVPIGRLEPGRRVAVDIPVSVPPGIEPREDLVKVRLRADRRDALRLGEQVLAARSSPLPEVAVRARLVPRPGGTHRAEIVLQNLSGLPIADIEARFAYPHGLDVELVDMAAKIPVLGAHDEQRLDLTLAIGPSAPAALPLELEIRAGRYGTLLDWPLSLPAGGAEVKLQGPRIEPRHEIVSAPVGRFALPLVARDDRRLDHVVVFANGEKVAWTPGMGSQAEVRAVFELKPGANRVLVVAEDDQGLRARRWFQVRGVTPGSPEPHEPASVDASEP